MRRSRRSSMTAGEPAAANADDGGDAPSRTERKNASENLQKLGEALLSLRPASLAKLPVPEQLRDALVEAKRLSNFGARRRQLQYVGKLMRRLEPATLQAAVDALRAEPGGAAKAASLEGAAARAPRRLARDR